jgi:hypothetical protein
MFDAHLNLEDYLPRTNAERDPTRLEVEHPTALQLLRDLQTAREEIRESSGPERLNTVIDKTKYP